MSLHQYKLEVMIHSEQCKLFLSIASRMETWVIQWWLSLMVNERRKKKKLGQESTVEVVNVLSLLMLTLKEKRMEKIK